MWCYKNTMEIKFAEAEQDFIKCFEVIKALRPHLTLDQFLSLIPELKKETYRLAFIEENGKAVSACGFRYLTTLFEGKYIYIDDLSTLPEAIGKGHAGALFDFVVEIAKKEGLPAVHLDSGHQRFDAHRLYLNKGMKIVYHHFRLQL